MIPSLLMGVITNIYIAGIILYLGDYPVLLNPLLATVLFFLLYILLKSDKLSATQSFYSGAYLVAAEVSVNTFFFGWECGFIYFLALLPAVLLLNFEVKIWQIVSFSSSILLLLIFLGFNTDHAQSAVSISQEVALKVNFLNAIITGLVFLVILVYFSRTIHKNDRMLLNVISDLELSNQKIGKQHEQQKILLKEIHHRVKNNLQIISSLMSLQSRNVDNDEVVGVLNESRRRVEAIALIHQKLYQDDKGNKVDFKSYLEEFIQSHRTLNSKICFSLDSDEITLHLDCAVPLGLIISELFTNAIKHAFDTIESPELTISIALHGREVKLWIRDNGNGLPPNFDMMSENLGLGTDIILSLTEQIDGKLNYYNDEGANFILTFRSQSID